tara:strand:+ start:316 stop:768 length:453 start_codon:yes stop_codon:yes gene_type:complete
MKPSWSLIRRLRKSIIFLVLLVVILTAKRGCEDIQARAASTLGKPNLSHSLYHTELILSKKIIKNKPLGLLSDFVESDKRLHLFFKRNTYPELIHIYWYQDGLQITQTTCSAKEENCISSLNPKMSKPGFWSIDVIQNEFLIASKQFEIQ